VLNYFNIVQNFREKLLFITYVPITTIEISLQSLVDCCYF